MISRERPRVSRRFHHMRWMELWEAQQRSIHPEVRERAVWLFQQAETLRSWVQRAEARADPRRNAALAERERLKQLERENAELT